MGICAYFCAIVGYNPFIYRLQNVSHLLTITPLLMKQFYSLQNGILLAALSCLCALFCFHALDFQIYKLVIPCIVGLLILASAPNTRSQRLMRIVGLGALASGLTMIVLKVVLPDADVSWGMLPLGISFVWAFFVVKSPVVRIDLAITFVLMLATRGLLHVWVSLTTIVLVLLVLFFFFLMHAKDLFFVPNRVLAAASAVALAVLMLELGTRTFNALEPLAMVCCFVGAVFFLALWLRRGFAWTDCCLPCLLGMCMMGYVIGVTVEDREMQRTDELFYSFSSFGFGHAHWVVLLALMTVGLFRMYRHERISMR